MDRPDKRWIGLSEAARLLGVHPSTVRAWADGGKLQVHRTPGGHRRFLLPEIEQWGADRGRRASEAQVVIENVIGRTRLEVPRLQNQHWYLKLTETQREAYREESRRLLEQVGRFIGRPAEVAGPEAAQIGREYARISLQAKMTLIEAVEAFLFFRSFLMESLFSLSEVRSAPSWDEMHREASHFADRVLLALIEAYQRA
ncbi:MAG TPA: helix-turn-helix domain-containing protein [Anaerolineales bacterium]